MKRLTLRNNHFVNITYDGEGTASTLINIPSADLQYLKIDGNLYEDSELSFMFLQGLNPVNETYSSIEISGI